MCATLALALCAAPLVAHSAPPKPEGPQSAAPSSKAEALRLYEIGALQYEGGEYDKAADSFSRAFELDQDAILAYNAARSFEKCGDLEAAKRYYQHQLDLAPDDDIAQRARKSLELVEARLQERASQRGLESQRRGTLSLETHLSGEALLDGALLGSAPGLFEVPAGPHEVEVRRPGYQPERRQVQLLPGQTLALRLAPSPLPEPPNLAGWGGFGAMGLGLVLGALALELREDDHGLALPLGASALTVELGGLGLLLWSLLDDTTPRDLGGEP